MKTFKHVFQSALALGALVAFTQASAAIESPHGDPPRPERACGPELLGKGTASVYSSSLGGRPTASGEKLDLKALTAAHRTVPLGRTVEVIDLDTRKVVYVRINDRGPFTKRFLIDLTPAAVRALGHAHYGLYNVETRLCR